MEDDKQSPETLVHSPYLYPIALLASTAKISRLSYDFCHGDSTLRLFSSRAVAASNSGHFEIPRQRIRTTTTQPLSVVRTVRHPLLTPSSSQLHLLTRKSHGERGMSTIRRSCNVIPNQKLHCLDCYHSLSVHYADYAFL